MRSNTHKDSNIWGIQIPEAGASPLTTILMVVYENPKKTLTLAYERIVLFYNRCKQENPDKDHRLSPELLETIRESYKEIFSYYDQITKPSSTSQPMSQEDINQLCYTAADAILEKMRTVTNKPIVIIYGDTHLNPESLLAIMALFKIYKELGGKTICLERTNKDLLESDQRSYSEWGIHSLYGMEFLKAMAKTYDMSVTPVDDEKGIELFREWRKDFLEYSTDEKSLSKSEDDKVGKILEEKFNRSVAMRDETMAKLVAEHSLSQWKKGNPLTFFVCGAAHLEGIVHNDIISKNCTPLVFNFTAQSRSYAPPVSIPYEKQKTQEITRRDEKFAVQFKLDNRLCVFESNMEIYYRIGNAVNAIMQTSDHTPFIKAGDMVMAALRQVKRKDLNEENSLLLDGLIENVKTLQSEEKDSAEVNYIKLYNIFYDAKIMLEESAEEDFDDDESEQSSTKKINPLYNTVCKILDGLTGLEKSAFQRSFQEKTTSKKPFSMKVMGGKPDEATLFGKWKEKHRLTTKLGSFSDSKCLLM